MGAGKDKQSASKIQYAWQLEEKILKKHSGQIWKIWFTTIFKNGHSLELKY